MQRTTITALNNTTVKNYPGQTIWYAHTDDELENWAEYKQVMENLGGHYVNKARGFRFGYNVWPLLEEAVITDTMPPANPLAYFPTPLGVVKSMSDYATDADQFPTRPTYKNVPMRILEPSAGTGAIAGYLRDHMDPEGTLHVCELNPFNRSLLELHGFSVVGDDFLAYVPDEAYDLIVMNPPFSVQGDKQAYITHIRHALDLLYEGGTLVAIAPVGFTFGGQGITQDFLRDVCYMGAGRSWAAGFSKRPVP